jgi:phosphoglycolate phosphatase
MSSPIRAVIFDLDGTLIDSRADIARSANRALSTLGFAELPVEVISEFVGDGAPRLLERAARVAPDDPRLSRLVAAFLDEYAAHPVVTTSVFPGAREALEALSALPLGLCTNKPRVTTELVLRALDLERHFRGIVAGDDLPRKKPDPLPILHLAEKLDVPVKSVPVVGDGAQDIEAGRAAGARAVGVRHGIQPIERLLAASPERVLDSLDELPAYVAELGSS